MKTRFRSRIKFCTNRGYMPKEKISGKTANPEKDENKIFTIGLKKKIFYFVSGV